VFTPLNSFLSNIQKRPVLFFLFWFLVFFGLSIILRLPHFLSNAFWFDGDEAIVGLMAQDLLEGKTFPLYFYGQTYGLSTFEACTVAIWIKLIGSGIWALRLGGLTLFALGTTFIFYGLIARKHPILTAALIAFSVLCFPPWILWGSMVRGGYVTAFCAISVLFYLSATHKRKVGHFTLIGFVLAVAYESHVFLLLPIIPFLLLNLLNQQAKIRGLVSILAWSIAFVLFFKWINFQENYWHSPQLKLDLTVLPDRFFNYVKGILHSFGGFYYYTANVLIPSWWAVALVLVLGLIARLLLKLFSRISRSQKLVMFMSLGTTVLIFILTLSIKNYSPRYVLSIYTAWLFIFLFFSKEALESKFIRNVGLLILGIFMVGIFAGNKLKRDWYDSTENRQEEFKSLYRHVKQQKFKAVFVCDQLMQWQWNYLYGKEIPANGFQLKDRTMSFTLATDSIYRANPKQTAIIGYWGVFYTLDYVPGFNDTRKQVTKDYFIQPIVTKEFHDYGYKQMGDIYKR
jgi:hypothetical protein